MLLLMLAALVGAVTGCATSGGRGSTRAAPPTAQTAGLEEIFQAYTNPAAPGCAVAIIKNGKVIYERGYGCANLEYGIPITPSTVFYIASAAKQFTAMSVLLLVKEGKLSLEDDIRKYLPEVPDFGKLITIRHLLHHTSGLRNYEDLLTMAGWRGDDVHTREHMLDMISRQKELNFAPGEEYLYCNTGYILLAEIVRRVSGQSFREFTDRNIFQPLGMLNSHFQDDHTMIITNRAFSYSSDGNGSFKNAFANSSVVGGGGMYSTVGDLARWLNNFDRGLVGGPGVLKQMHERGVLNSGKTNDYACGLAIQRYKDMEMVEHGGGFAGYRSETMRFPAQRFAIVLLANANTVDTFKITRQIADLFLTGTRPLTNPPAPKRNLQAHALVEPDSAALEAYTGKYEVKGEIITVRIADKKLLARAGGPEVELVPESQNAFVVEEDQSRVLFHRDQSGKVMRLTIEKQNGETHTAHCITPLNPQKVSELIGDYYSDELETSYTIRVSDNQLIAQHHRHGQIPLLQSSVADKFVAEGWFDLVFTRNNEGTVTGFKLSTDRCRNLQFQRRP
jgi:CubicO group peptidase (beta-lactamase class C family)